MGWVRIVYHIEDIIFFTQLQSTHFEPESMTIFGNMKVNENNGFSYFTASDAFRASEKK